METWCRWENARKGSSFGLDRIHSSDGAGIRPLVQHPRAEPKFQGPERMRSWGGACSQIRFLRMLSAIVGTVQVDRGTIKLGEDDVTRWAASRRAIDIGRVFQEPRLGTCDS